ncbi:MAG: four helix bundle protein [Actinomycetota bacterium]
MDTDTRHDPARPTAAPQLPLPGWQPGAFDHHRLHAFRVARQALADGEALARRLPRGTGTLSDQLRRALLSAYLQVAEAAHRTGADRAARFRGARGEAGEAAAALEAVTLLGLAPASQVAPVLVLLARLCAMLTRLMQPPRS